MLDNSILDLNFLYPCKRKILASFAIGMIKNEVICKRWLWSRASLKTHSALLIS